MNAKEFSLSWLDYLLEKNSFQSSTGIEADVSPITPLLKTYTIKGERVQFGGKLYTRLKFTPGDRVFLDPERLTDSLANGILGFSELIAAINKRKFKPAPVFAGRSNINMALLSQKFGFTIVDQCFGNDRLLKDIGEYTIIGWYPNIKTRVEEFKNQQFYNNLIKRYRRIPYSEATPSR